MSGCCRGLPAKVCWARPYGCSDEPPDRSSLVGGAQKDMSDPKTTAEPERGTPEWSEALRQIIAKCERLGLHQIAEALRRSAETHG